ncbi:unnamed protein product [Ambrosiozyma monospora]|uniref:Unnamed protein product n=1 Tax=Ambrosiozyma monospora TaxID=43982 RepID=A0ACB5TEY1_AMBMO|nr:unnamed protein product [Ambrosiozyma monospora]
MSMASCLKEVHLEPMYARPNYAKLVPIGFDFDGASSITTSVTTGNTEAAEKKENKSFVSLEYGEVIRTTTEVTYCEKLCYLHPVSQEKSHSELLANMIMACLQCFDIESEMSQFTGIPAYGYRFRNVDVPFGLDPIRKAVIFNDLMTTFNRKLEALFKKVKNEFECRLVCVESKTPFPPRGVFRLILKLWILAWLKYIMIFFI